MKPPLFLGRFAITAPRSLLALSVTMAVLGSVLAAIIIMDAEPVHPKRVTVEAGKPTTTTTGPHDEEAPSPLLPEDVAANTLTSVAGNSFGATAHGTTTTARTAVTSGSGLGAPPAAHGPGTTTPAPHPAPGPPTTPPPVAYPTGPGDPILLGQLYVVEVAGGVAHSVAVHRDLLDRAEWSPDGHRVLYGIYGADYQTLTVRPDGTGRGQLPGGGIETPTWSSRGDLVRVEYDGTGHNLRINPATGGTRRVTHQHVGTVTGRAWSPDGSRVALIAGGRVWIAHADGSGARAVTPDGGKAWKWLHWSPDGTRIAYYEDGHLWVVGADGANRLQLAPANADPGFSWSPDGKELVVVGPFGASPRLAISVVPAAGGPLRPLGVQGIEVSWSPDGKTIAYSSWPVQNSTMPLALISPDGTNKRMLLTPPPQTYFGLGIEWSPDSTHLLVNTGRAGDGGPGEPD